MAVILMLALAACGEQVTQLPAPLEDLITYDLPEEYQLDREYLYDGDDEFPIIEKGYTSEHDGYFSVGVFSYQGFDCLGDVTQKIDFDEYINGLADMREITIDGETGYIGTNASDDMPGMVAVAYVKHGDYVFEYRLSNGDEQVTKAQLKQFEQIVCSTKFTCEMAQLINFYIA